jgi:hypothetical protein
MEERVREYYQLKADLLSVKHIPGSTRLILEFDKRVDPELSAMRLTALLGFVILNVKKPRGWHKQDEGSVLKTDQARLV